MKRTSVAFAASLVSVAGIALTLTWLLDEPSLAQSTQADPRFEVASIRPNMGGGNSMGAFAQPGGRFGARNVPLRFLICSVYDVKDFQVVIGNASWIITDRYDVSAKAPEGTANGFEPIRPMLQSMLADRFGLVVHRETKEMPVYNLVPAKGGLKLATPKDKSCLVPDTKNPRPSEQTPFCNRVRTGRGLIEAYGVTMPRLLTALSDALGRVVIDKTGFKGIFDCRLEFTPDEAFATAIDGNRAVQPAPAADTVHPSVFTALQEQLGLKVESAKGPIEVVVIDHAQRPTSN